MKILLSIVYCVLLGCNNENYPSLILVHNKTVSQYNDTTFNSSGYISHFSNGYVISDDINKFVATVDHDVNSLEIIGRVGRGPDEYPYPPRSFIQVGNSLYAHVARKLYIYDLSKRIRSETDISSISKSIKDDLIYHRGNELIFPLQGHGQEYNFVSYNVNNGQIEYFHKNSVLNKLFQDYTYNTVLLNNDIFVVVKYDHNTKKGFIHTFSLTDENVSNVTEIPLNPGIMEILKVAPQAPVFNGICSWKNRIFIAYNSTGLVTTEINGSGQNSSWFFLNYPDEKEDDRVILSNFCITDENLIFVNQGLLRFYQNPFKD
jgi:hypothetical protein